MKTKKRQKPKLPKFKKRYILFSFIACLILYLIVAYNYFYYVQRDAHIIWPENNNVYQFDDSPDPSKLYIALGDSLTYSFGADNYEAGYTYQIADFLAENNKGLSLKDYSYPGFRSDDIIKQLDLVIVDKPKIITLFIGVNDTHQLVETSNFQKNYDHILQRLTDETEAKIYAINVPYLGARSIQWPPYNYYFDAKTRSHNKTIQESAKKYNVGYIDLYTPTAELFKNSGPHYSRDSFHPSSYGYKIWTNIIKDAVTN